MRSYSVEQLSSIKLYFKRGTDLYRARQLVQERLAGSPCRPGRAALHDAAPVLHRPGHEDRAHLGRAVPDRHVGDRLLDDQEPSAARARRGAGDDLRRAAQTAARPGRPGEAGGARRLARDGHGADRERDGRRRAPVLRGLHRRHGRLHRVERSAAERPQRAADRHRRRLAKVPIERRNGELSA